MSLPKIAGQNLKKPLCYDPARNKFIRFDEIVSKQEPIVPLETLSGADLKKLIIERQRQSPDYKVQAISGAASTRDDVIRAIEQDKPLGRATLEAETSYLKDLLGQIQASLK